MPLMAWLNLIIAGLVVLAVSPLTAAQLMLMIDRYLGGHFFDTQAGGSAVMWMHFFWIFARFRDPGFATLLFDRILPWTGRQLHIFDGSGSLAYRGEKSSYRIGSAPSISYTLARGLHRRHLPIQHVLLCDWGTVGGYRPF
jgi:hypothetical protein